jgi:hypothetical protein
MSKYTFTYEDDHDDNDSPSRSITHEVDMHDKDTWMEVIEQFTEFLRGVGFIFPKHGQFEMIDQEQTETGKCGGDCSGCACHSED